MDSEGIEGIDRFAKERAESSVSPFPEASPEKVTAAIESAKSEGFEKGVKVVRKSQINNVIGICEGFNDKTSGPWPGDTYPIRASFKIGKSASGEVINQSSFFKLGELEIIE